MSEERKTIGRKSESTGSLKIVQLPLLGLFVVAIGFLIARQFSSQPSPSGTLDSLALILALVTTLVSLGSQLPAQNIALAAVIIAAIGGGIHALNTLTGIPFGLVNYTQASGPRLFGALAWFVPLWWIVAILSSRGVVRLILRPWRKTRTYGFWLIGITTALALLLELAFEPFATRVRDYWIWSPSKLSVDWFGTPLSDFLGWLVATLLILAFSTPALMKRKPAKSGPDYYPLVVWLALNFLFIAGAISQHLLPAAIVSAIACAAVIAFSIRGAKW